MLQIDVTTQLFDVFQHRQSRIRDVRRHRMACPANGRIGTMSNCRAQ